MTGGRLRHEVWTAIREAADRLPYVASATLTGSCAATGDPAATSAIGLVVLIDRLTAERFLELKTIFAEAVRPSLAAAGLDLRLNPTLGPLKFDSPGIAVLHLMVYTLAGHIDHVVQSPFTCLDWQRTTHFHKRSLADAYPVFGLQPKHFFNARRSAREYLKDFRNNVVSYRELECEALRHREVPRTKPMTLRDRHEFAYHVMKFLMGNLLKLVSRENRPFPGPEPFFEVFPEGREQFGGLFHRLANWKKARDYSMPLPNLDAGLEAFVDAFERQFRREFHESATRHLVFRHAATPLNGHPGRQRKFLGRTNPDIIPIEAPPALVALANELRPSRGYVSPANRCRQSYSL